MLELLAYLVPIVIADAMNPVLAAAVIFALGTRQPYRAAFWVLFGWFAVYFPAGIGLAAARLIAAAPATSMAKRPTRPLACFGSRIARTRPPAPD